VVPEIVALAEEIGAGLIVMGSRGLGGIRRALMGSVSDSVVRHAHCPCWWCASKAARDGLRHRPLFTDALWKIPPRSSTTTTFT
jgi:hypothetical protein